MFGALKCGFQSMVSLMLVRNAVGELQPKRTLAASRGFLAAARLSCLSLRVDISKSVADSTKVIQLMTNRKSHGLSIDTKIDDFG